MCTLMEKFHHLHVNISGNGPSGICLSYMLAGNWPYYTGEPHPGDEMLTARLANGSSSAGLAGSTRWGLESLSNGLEGRSGGKPLSLLVDHLQHPCTDAGLDLPPLLAWLPPNSTSETAEHKVFDHVVLGKGPPGGAWQVKYLSTDKIETRVTELETGSSLTSISILDHL